MNLLKRNETNIMSYSKSFASLTKNNNGVFKSAAQAKFLLSVCDGTEYISTGNVYGNPFTLSYQCDEKGVIKVIKHTSNTCKTITTWERKESGKTTIQDAKLIKKIKKEIKGRKSSIDDRKESIEDYKERGMMNIYTKSMDLDLQRVRDLSEQLNLLSY